MQNNASPAGEKILEGNKTIMVFMGYNLNGDGKKMHFNITKPGQDHWYYGSWEKCSFNEHIVNEFKYHSSWDLLMPVCKRIVEMYFDKREEIFLGLNKCNIEDTWKAVVKFISFLNDDTQEKMIWRSKPVSEQQLKWRNSKINEWYNQQTPSNDKEATGI